jgi:hypothetical protein
LSRPSAASLPPLVIIADHGREHSHWHALAGFAPSAQSMASFSFHFCARHSLLRASTVICQDSPRTAFKDRLYVLSQSSINHGLADRAGLGNVGNPERTGAPVAPFTLEGLQATTPFLPPGFVLGMCFSHLQRENPFHHESSRFHVTL